MKVVLDTNVVISAIFFGGDPLKIVRAARSRRIELVATHAVLSEYHEVAERLHEQYPAVAYRRPLAILESLLVIVSPTTLPERRVCRDPDDDAIIACALGAKATERVIRRFNNREITLRDAVAALGVGKTRVYNLRTQWLVAGRNATFLGVSGGDSCRRAKYGILYIVFKSEGGSTAAAGEDKLIFDIPARR